MSHSKSRQRKRLGGSLADKRRREAEKKRLKTKANESSSKEPPRSQLEALLTLYKTNDLSAALKMAGDMSQACPKHPFAWKILGVVFHQQGQLPEAQRMLLKALRLAPEDPELYRTLGDVLADIGDIEEAAGYYQSALSRNPNDTAALHNCALALTQLGRPLDAIQACERAFGLDPSFAEAYNTHGNALVISHRFEEACASFEAALKLRPDFTAARLSLSNSLIMLDRFEDAKRHAQLVEGEMPDCYEAHVALSLSLNGAGKIEEAIEALQTAIRLRPNVAEAHNDLALLLVKSGRYVQAEESYRLAIALDPKLALAHSNLGFLLILQERLEEAAACCRVATELAPDLAAGFINLGMALARLWKLDEAEEALRVALELQPQSATVLSNLGNLLKDAGRRDEATLVFRRAIELEPAHKKSRDNLLFTLNYDPTITSGALFREYKRYGEWASSVTKRPFVHSNKTFATGRRLRIGYSSPDFRGHVCRYFMEPLFCNHDRTDFELFAYSNTLNPDVHTERFQDYFDHWVDVTRMTDEQMAQRINDDQIDILVDMAGHTAGNRLMVFAMRPAPIQVSSSIGYGYTTGLEEIDYFLGDENLTPPGSEAYFSEAIWRMPGSSFLYQPPIEIAPEVSDPPVLKKGYITFGSLVRTVRLNDPVFSVWKQILDEVPNSRLRLDQKPFQAESIRKLFWERLEKLGIPRHRVELDCSNPHWNAYRDIDITLDCWPHNGGTTTLESLWMGVPVISKIDRPAIGSIGAAMLRPLGLSDWLVETDTDYISKAVELASDVNALRQFRFELRERISCSPYLDADQFTDNLGAAYRQMAETHRIGGA